MTFIWDQIDSSLCGSIDEVIPESSLAVKSASSQLEGVVLQQSKEQNQQWRVSNQERSLLSAAKSG